MGDAHNRLAWLESALADLDRQRLRRYPTTCAAAPGGKLLVPPFSTSGISQGGTGVSPVQSEIAPGATGVSPVNVPEPVQLANFGANDYLALAGDTRLSAAAAQAALAAGWGSGASPLITGRTPWHEKLQTAIAAFEGTEAALLFTSGFAANAGTIPALVERGDAVFGDQKNHASIIDGCRLSRAEVFVYPHVASDALEDMLRSSAAQFRRRLIVTDTLFSMDGNFAPLPRLCELAEKYDAMLMIDEAHATGVFGARGRGVAELLEVEDRVDIRVGTLSKTLGSHGGFVAGPQTLIDYLANRARSYVFATAPPAALAAASLQAIELVKAEPWRREQLLAKAARVRAALRSQGWNIGSSASQIIPLLVGTPERALQLSATLRERGFFVPAIRPPSVPAGESLLRLSLSYAHSDELLGQLLENLHELSSRGVGGIPSRLPRI